MSKLNRYTQKIFGSGAGLNQISKFGSLFAGSPAFTTTPDQAMSLSNWLTGWFAAAIGGNSPAIEDMNSAFFVLAYQVAYIMQAGISEWDTGTTYYIGSIVNVAGKTYVSTTDNNIANLVTDPANWTLIGGQVLTTLGDWIYGGLNGALTRLAGNVTTTPQILIQTGDGLGSSAAPTLRDFKPPTRQVFKTGAGTYTKPAGVMYLRIRMVGGSGGGAGSGTGTSGGSGGVGAPTTFGGTLLICGNGDGGNDFGVGSGGSGGGYTVNSPALDLGSFNGATGQNGMTGTSGGMGGVSPFGGAGVGLTTGDAQPNTGSGGGGAGTGSLTVNTGGGGGAGGYIEALIPNPSGTYAYAVGGGGNAGVAGTTGNAGGVGSNGIIIVEEYYQ